MLNLKERQFQLREDVIIETAQHLLLEHGYIALNMDDVATQTGISKATLYQHFSSKDELVIQAILRRMKKGEQVMLELAPTTSPIELLEHIVRYSVQKRISMASAHFELPPNLREDPRIKAQHARFAEYLSRLIEQGKADNTIRAELSIPVVVRMFFTIFSPAHQDLLRDEVVSPEEMSETLVTIFLKGIRSS